MAISNTPWTISKEELEAALAMPPIRPSLYDQIVKAEREFLDMGIRLALGLWVSELEPELMFRVGSSRPIGVTAKSHHAAYILIKWDQNFYMEGEPRRVEVRYWSAP